METIYDFIKEQETKYSQPIELEDGWPWNMKEHLRRSFLYKNSQFTESNENRDLRPNKNIVLPILNVQYRTEGFDVKDIEIYVNDPEESYKSFLVRKFHEKWALENKIDTFIDDMVESYVDYGGVLVRDTASNRPEVIDLRSIAFCNQTDLIAYPFGIKHKFSAAQLREQDKWGGDGATIDIETLISLCKKQDEDEIEVYEVHGTMPREWLTDETFIDESKKDIQQIQVVAFYKKENGDEQGATLFRHKEPKLPFKFLSRDQIIGRALGRGGVEELFDPIIWTNWNEVKITEMMEAASKMIGVTTDPTLAAKHPSGMKDMDNMEFLQVTAGTDVKILDTYPRNLAVFNDAMERWQNHAQIVGAASETLLGEQPTSGTPFKLYEAKVIEDKSMHRFRQGKLATFMDEIYRDWTLPHLSREAVNDQEFLSDLSADELMDIAEKVATKRANRKIVDSILSGKMKEDEEFRLGEDAKALKEITKQNFIKGGTKRFIQILKKEITKPLSVLTNIAGKQKNLALLTDKLVGLVRQYLASPQLRQDPEMGKIINAILESSGLSPIMYGLNPLPEQQLQPQQVQQAQQPALAAPQA